jgi:hypothetical protein
MEKNNKLIAEFMGMKNINPNDDTIYQLMVAKKGSGLPHEFPIGNEIIPTKSLKYHKSWDWLMPVANEIIKSRDEQNADWDLTELKYALSTTNIDLVYKAVVEFIKDYNQNYNNLKTKRHEKGNNNRT